MKTLKLILTNLILVFTLVILTGGMVFADGITDVNITVNRDSNNKPISYELQVIKDGKVATLDELNKATFSIANLEDQNTAPIGIYILLDTTMLETKTLEDCREEFPYWIEYQGSGASSDVLTMI